MKTRRVKDRDYSMHLLPIDSKAKMILGAFDIEEERPDSVLDIIPGVHVPAITTNGRISFLFIGNSDDFIRIQHEFRKRIEERYPKENYPDVCTYVCAAVVLTSGDGKSIGFIFEVWGFTEPVTELEQIYRLLADVTANLDKDRTEVEKFLSSEPVKSWVNGLIEFLKQEMNWTEYVKQAYHQLRGNTKKESSKWALKAERM